MNTNDVAMSHLREAVPTAQDDLQPPKPVLFISVSIGWVIRNFFQTGVIERLGENFDVVALATSKTQRSLCNLGFNKEKLVGFC